MHCNTLQRTATHCNTLDALLGAGIPTHDVLKKSSDRTPCKSHLILLKIPSPRNLLGEGALLGAGILICDSSGYSCETGQAFTYGISNLVLFLSRQRTANFMSIGNGTLQSFIKTFKHAYVVV